MAGGYFCFCGGLYLSCTITLGGVAGGVYGVFILIDAVLLFGFGKKIEARRYVADKFSNGEDNPGESGSA